MEIGFVRRKNNYELNDSKYDLLVENKNEYISELKSCKETNEPNINYYNISNETNFNDYLKLNSLRKYKNKEYDKNNKNQIVINSLSIKNSTIVNHTDLVHLHQKNKSNYNLYGLDFDNQIQYQLTIKSINDNFRNGFKILSILETKYKILHIYLVIRKIKKISTESKINNTDYIFNFQPRNLKTDFSQLYLKSIHQEIEDKVFNSKKHFKIIISLFSLDKIFKFYNNKSKINTFFRQNSITNNQAIESYRNDCFLIFVLFFKIKIICYNHNLKSFGFSILHHRKVHLIKLIFKIIKSIHQNMKKDFFFSLLILKNEKLFILTNPHQGIFKNKFFKFSFIECKTNYYNKYYSCTLFYYYLARKRKFSLKKVINIFKCYYMLKLNRLKIKNNLASYNLNLFEQKKNLKETNHHNGCKDLNDVDKKLKYGKNDCENKDEYLIKIESSSSINYFVEKNNEEINHLSLKHSYISANEVKSKSNVYIKKKEIINNIKIISLINKKMSDLNNENSQNTDQLNSINFANSNEKYEKAFKGCKILNLIVSLKSTIISNEVYFPVFSLLRTRFETIKFISVDFKRLINIRNFCTKLNSVIVYENVIRTKAFTNLRLFARKMHLHKKIKIDHSILSNTAIVCWEMEKRILPKRKNQKLLILYYKLYMPLFKHQINYNRKLLVEYFESWRQLIFIEKVELLHEIKRLEEDIDIYSEKIVNYENNTEVVDEKVKLAIVKGAQCTACKGFINPGIYDFNATSSMIKDETMHQINIVPQFNINEFMKDKDSLKNNIYILNTPNLKEQFIISRQTSNNKQISRFSSGIKKMSSNKEYYDDDIGEEEIIDYNEIARNMDLGKMSNY
jgi:hypothetical protein